MSLTDIELKGLNTSGIEQKYTLGDFGGERLLVYFYPQDDTPVCTKEASDFRDAMPELEKFVRVIGVSGDNIDNHIEFRYNHSLNFILLSDPDGELKREFRKKDRYITNIKRSTFILDTCGNVVKYWNNVDADGHIEEILEYLRSENKGRYDM